MRRKGQKRGTEKLLARTGEQRRERKRAISGNRVIRTRKLLVGSEGAVDDKLFRDAKQRLRKTLVEDGPIRRTLKPNKKEKGNNGRRSIWRLEVSGVTNARLAS